MRHFSLLSIVTVLIIALFFGCKTNSTGPETNPNTISTIIAGQVLDESGKPVSGALIACYGTSALTNQYGTFIIKDVTAPAERCVMKATKSGYFDGFRAEKPIAGGLTQMRIALISNTPQGAFASSAGGTITARGSQATVEFPSDGYVGENGTAYTGNVQYAVRYLDPTSPQFYDFFPGDFRGIRLDSTITEMVSYGVLQVELHGSSGEKINLAPGKSATVSYPIPAKMTTDAPSEMPLWWFDEAKGMWHEDGKAAKKGDRYVGTVTHFTPWNCDKARPIRTDAFIRVRVLCDNQGVAGVVVRIGQTMVGTDTNGYASSAVPYGSAFTVQVHPESNNGLESVEYAAGPYNMNSSNQLEVQLTKCPPYISGTITDCSGSLADAVLVAEYSDKTFGIGYSAHGKFRIPAKISTGMILTAYSDAGRESVPMTIPPLTFGQNYAAGVLSICNSSVITTQDYDLNTDVQNQSQGFLGRVMLSADGSRAFVYFGGKVQVVNTITGAMIRRINLGSSIEHIDSLLRYQTKLFFDISADGTTMLVLTDMKDTGNGIYSLYNVNSGTQIREYSSYFNISMSPDGTKLLCTGVDNTRSVVISIVDAATGATIRQTSTLDGIKLPIITNHTDFFTNETFGLVNEEYTNALKIVSSNDFSLLHAIPIRYPDYVAQSPDGSIIGASEIGSLLFFNTKSGAALGSTSQFHSPLHDVGIAPSNDRYVSQKDNSTFAIYAIANGQFVRSLPIMAGVKYYSPQYSKDGKKLVAAFKENNRLKLRMWNF